MPSEPKNRTRYLVDPDKLVKTRLAKGLSQKELAERAEVAVSWICKLEIGFALDTSINIAEKCAQVLCCSPSDFAKPFYYSDPVPLKAAPSFKFRDHASIDPKIFSIGKRYLINGEKLILEQKCVARTVIHYLFKQPTGGWRISYTSIDFRVGDVAVQAL